MWRWFDGKSGRLFLFEIGLFDGDFGGFFDQVVMGSRAGNVVKVDAELFAVPSLLVNVSEDVHFGPDSLHKFQQTLTATFFFLIDLI